MTKSKRTEFFSNDTRTCAHVCVCGVGGGGGGGVCLGRYRGTVNKSGYEFLNTGTKLIFSQFLE